MGWFNLYGLAIMAVIMIPNVIFAVTHKGGFENLYKNKAAEITENVSRYACFLLMVFNVPYTWVGFYFPSGEVFYLTVNASLTVAYCTVWIVMRKKSGIVKTLLLSALPSLIFLFSGIMIVSVPLIVFSVIFSVSHVLVSVKNSLLTFPEENVKTKITITVVSIILFTALTVAATACVSAVFSVN